MKKFVKAHQVNIFVAGFSKDPPNIRLENFVILTTCNDLTNFNVKRMLWLETEVLWISFMEKFVKAHQVNLFVAGFRHLKPQCDRHEARKPPPTSSFTTGVLLFLQFSPPDSKWTFAPRISAIKVILLAKHTVNGHLCGWFTSTYIEVSTNKSNR